MSLFFLRTAASAAIGSCLAFTSAAASEKILVAPSSGKATVISLTGADSSRATVTFRQEREDVLAACFERDEIHTRYEPDPSAAREKLKADCAAKPAPPPATLTRSADCTRLSFRMEADYLYEGGVFILRKYKPDGDYMRTEWMSERSKKLIGNCLTCGSPEINDTFRVLCPIQYKERFSGREPF
jgi:hypothetical protein